METEVSNQLSAEKQYNDNGFIIRASDSEQPSKSTMPPKKGKGGPAKGCKVA